MIHINLLITHKKCSSCLIEKPATLEFFGKKQHGKYGLHGRCRECLSRVRKIYYSAHTEVLKSKRETKKAQISISNSVWHQKIKGTELHRRRLQYTYAYRKHRYHTDEKFNTYVRLRTRFNAAMRAFAKTGKLPSKSLHSIDFRAILSHLGPRPGPADEWHLDHIKPVVAFDLSDPAQVKLCWSVENLQWLPSSTNIKKSSYWQGKRIKQDAESC